MVSHYLFDMKNWVPVLILIFTVQSRFVGGILIIMVGLSKLGFSYFGICDKLPSAHVDMQRLRR